MFFWFWLKANIISSPKYTVIDTSGNIKKCQFPKLYAITKVLIANQILYDGLNKIKQERRYHNRLSYTSSYYASCEEVINIEKKALKLYKEAAHFGCLIAYAIIGYYHENGLAGLPVSFYKAERYYTLGLGSKSLKHNNKSAAGLSLIRLSFLKQYGRPGIIINQRLAKQYKKQAKALGPNVTLHWIESLAKLEHISSLFIVASSYYNGLGVERDVEKAYHFAKIAAEYGNSGAQNLIGMINYEGTETLEKNEEMALKWYRKAAKSNEAAALYNLAMLYENGAVVMQNYNEAFKYYKMASDYGSISGTNIIGFFYEHGIGTKRSKLSAFKNYLKAASKGSPFGQYNLGRCFLYGIGIEKNTANALKWFELAGIQGHGNSYLTLAVLFDVGIKVSKNYELAKKYYILAYRNNVKTVDKRLMAGIAIDVLRVSRFLLSLNSNSSDTLLNDLHYKNSCETLSCNNCDVNNNLKLNFSSQTKSLLTLHLRNDNQHENNRETEIKGNIMTLQKDIDMDSEELNKISSSINNSKNFNNNDTTINITKENIKYSSSYPSVATSSSSLNTITIQGLDNQEKENVTENETEQIFYDETESSLELSEIMEYIQQFDSTSKSTNFKRNYLSELPNELKYHIIQTVNPDGILSNETMNKIYKYVLQTNNSNGYGITAFETKADFLNYLGIEDFKLKDKIQCTTEERVNSLLNQYHED
jgi:TPR repeat protein